LYNWIAWICTALLSLLSVYLALVTIFPRLGG
jgi:hypothetical protein